MITVRGKVGTVKLQTSRITQGKYIEVWNRYYKVGGGEKKVKENKSCKRTRGLVWMDINHLSFLLQQPPKECFLFLTSALETERQS